MNKGYKCWLNYSKLKNILVDDYTKWCTNILINEKSEIFQIIKDEICQGIKEIIGVSPCISNEILEKSLIIGTTSIVEKEFSIILNEKDQIDNEGYIIKALKKDKFKNIIITGKTDISVLYGVFEFLKLLRMGKSIQNICIVSNPSNQLRMINHWDNMDGSIERGYAGKSIFFNDNKFIRDYKRIKDYARLLCSIGINAIVINNVNVHKIETRLISTEFYEDLKQVADIFLSYGIKLFLSINYASTIEMGGLDTADPLDSNVKNWWCEKAKEIYAQIPNFGGFLVKADSEFRPGPFTYNRNHADGANMLADALKPYGGIVIWRCFVYNCEQDWRDRVTDRAKAAYDHFMLLDGKFEDNVILQIKNGPMDFQVREPVSPLFGGLKNTNQILEFQITQEYTGQQKHLCYLIPMWKEVLDFDTYAKGKDTKVKDIVGQKTFNTIHGGIAGVVNVGDDENWTGLQLAQSNLYGYGRLTWNPELSAEEITDEWVRLTFSNNEDVVNIVSNMLMNSWRTYENYTSPLGIGWMVNVSHHFGPSVDGYEYSKWGTYHRADIKGIGVDRTRENGTGYVAQYHKENREMYESIEKCPEELLLFFHHVEYNYKLKTGETLIQYIYNTHFDGVDQVIEMKNQWLKLEELIEKEIFKHVVERLEGQIEHAKEWRDVVNSYFFRKTGIADNKNRKIY